MRRRGPKSVTEIDPLTLWSTSFTKDVLKNLVRILHKTLTSVSIQAMQGKIQSVARTADKRQTYIYIFLNF